MHESWFRDELELAFRDLLIAMVDPEGESAAVSGPDVEIAAERDVPRLARTWPFTTHRRSNEETLATAKELLARCESHLFRNLDPAQLAPYVQYYEEMKAPFVS